MPREVQFASRLVYRAKPSSERNDKVKKALAARRLVVWSGLGGRGRRWMLVRRGRRTCEVSSRIVVWDGEKGCVGVCVFSIVIFRG